MKLEVCSFNMFYHNNMYTKEFEPPLYGLLQPDASTSTSTFWDNGYPSGCNYWNEYSDVDLNRGAIQEELGAREWKCYSRRNKQHYYT